MIALAYLTGERDGFLRLFWREELARRAYHYQYQGKWEVVRQLVQLRLLTPYTVWCILLINFSIEDLFGNLLPLTGRIANTARLVKLYKRNSQTVIYPKRKRGYDDKGTLRPPEKWLPFGPFGSIIEREPMEPVPGPHRRHCWLGKSKQKGRKLNE